MRLYLYIIVLLLQSMALWSGSPNGLFWDWDKIDTEEVSFPKGFLWGAATSSYQTEGNCINNWTYCEQQLKERDSAFESAGQACDHWHRYKEDIQLLKDADFNTYRFSVEWSKIEPEEGIFDFDALEHYIDVCKELIAQGIKPVVTLYHYTEPIWFYKKGGFENEENIIYFVHYCQKLFEYLGPYVHMWFTFNAPSGIAFKGWYKGLMPPFKKDMQLAMQVLKNVLEAHVQVYQAIKQMPDGQDTRIGILKNIFQIDPLQPYNPIDLIASKMAYKMTDKCIYHFFLTGEFRFWIPTKAYVKHKNKAAPNTLDFIGLNYYSHMFVHNFTLVHKPEEIKTDNPRNVLYAEGLYRAIKSLSEQLAQPLNLPIYVTENGIATKTPELRELFFKRYLFALSKAIEDGYKVHGYINWALMDNYSWGTYKRKYGIYAVEFDNSTLARNLKIDAGTTYLLSIIKKFS